MLAEHFGIFVDDMDGDIFWFEGDIWDFLPVVAASGFIAVGIDVYFGNAISGFHED